jgi:type I restriction enzyme R subunit
MIVDFVNVPESIQSDFEPYYTDAFLETVTDPNLVHDIAAKLDTAGIYDDVDVDAVAVADTWVKGKGNQALDSAFAPTLTRFHTRRNNAIAADDKSELDALTIFTKDLGTFVRVYDFMSQVVNYGSSALEKRSSSTDFSRSVSTTAPIATTLTCPACRWWRSVRSTRAGATWAWGSASGSRA